MHGLELRITRKAASEFALGFVAIFLALTLPNPGLGPLYTRVHTALGNACLGDGNFASGASLRFEATNEQLRSEPWQTTLRVQAPAGGGGVRVPIELRTLAFLPTAAFISCALAAPLGSWRRNAKLLAIGLLVLPLLLAVMIAVPLLSFLGGTGPITVFTLGRSTHIFLQLIYRSLVSPPGMTYAIPLFLWWILLRLTRPTAKAASASNSAAEGNPA